MELHSSGTINGLPVVALTVADPSARTRIGIESQDTSNIDGVINDVLSKATDVCQFLYSDLTAKVFKAKDLKEISHVRTVLDLVNLLKKIKLSSPALVAAQNTSSFLASAEFIDPTIHVKCEPGELREQYQKFLRVLGDLNGFDVSNLSSSMAIVKKLMNGQDKLYFGMEMVMDIICQACTFKSVESVVESWISTLEHHSSKQRSLLENNINMEMTIAINGPPVQHSFNLAKTSMERYWKSSRHRYGHFVRITEDVRQYFVSEAVDFLRSSKCRHVLMM